MEQTIVAKSDVLPRDQTSEHQTSTILHADAEPDAAYVAAEPTDVVDFLIDTLPQLDIDGNASVSSDELDSAVVNDSFSGIESAFVAAVSGRRELIAGLAGDRQSLSIEDLQFLNGESHPTQDLLITNFSAFDLNNNDAISNGERKIVSLTDQFQANRDELITFPLLAYSGKDQEVSLAELSSAELPMTAQLVRDTEKFVERLHGSHDSLYATHNPVASIVPDAVRQGSIGNCYILAALASMAAVNPEAIEKMVRDNGDNTYTVSFPYPAEPITVDAPSDAELALYASGTEYGYWAAVIEKAYGVMRGGGTIPQLASDGGADLAAGLRVLTGLESYSENLDSFDDLTALEEHITSTLDAGRPITLATHPDHARAGLVQQHAYSILGYDQETGMVQIRNPWGHSEPSYNQLDPENNGVFYMPLSELAGSFEKISAFRNHCSVKSSTLNIEELFPDFIPE